MISGALDLIRYGSTACVLSGQNPVQLRPPLADAPRTEVFGLLKINNLLTKLRKIK